MTGPLARAAGFFVAPAAPAAAPPVAALPSAARAVVVGRADEVAPLAAAVALWLRAADRAPAALVAVWRCGDKRPPAARGAAMPSAARLAARLARRDLPATARGRLAWLALPADPAAAAGTVHRVAAIVEGPLVTALAGARPPELDALVAGHDVVVVAAEPDTPLARAALSGLPLPADRTVACPPLPRGVPAALALAGLRAPRAAPPALIPAEALR
jgi:hypothetical protein